MVGGVGRSSKCNECDDADDNCLANGRGITNYKQMRININSTTTKAMRASAGEKTIKRRQESTTAEQKKWQETRDSAANAAAKKKKKKGLRLEKNLRNCKTKTARQSQCNSTGAAASANVSRVDWPTYQWPEIHTAKTVGQNSGQVAKIYNMSQAHSVTDRQTDFSHQFWSLVKIVCAEK